MAWVLLRLPWLVAVVVAIGAWTVFSAFLPRGRYWALLGSLFGASGMLVALFFLSAPMEELAVTAGAFLLCAIAHAYIHKIKEGKA